MWWIDNLPNVCCAINTLLFGTVLFYAFILK